MDTGFPTTTPPDRPLWRRILDWPSTRLGWWAVALATAFLILFIVNAKVLSPPPFEVPWAHVLLPLSDYVMVFCRLAAAIVGLIAILRWHERSVLVWLTLMPGLFVLTFPVLMLL